MRRILVRMDQIDTVPPASRQEVLRATLLSTADLLKRRCAGQIGDDLIDAYVSMGWLEWNGGSLRLTEVGMNLCRQLKEGVGGRGR